MVLDSETIFKLSVTFWAGLNKNISITFDDGNHSVEIVVINHVIIPICVISFKLNMSASIYTYEIAIKSGPALS